MLARQANKTLKLAFPIILGEVSQMMLGIIDTAMVGAVNYKQLAAAALVMSVINIPFVFGIGITISVSQMVSMAHGRRDGKLVSHYLYNGFWLCSISAIVISIAIELSKNILFHLDQDPVVAQLALPYLQIMGWSVVPMLLFLSLKQFTDGLEFTKTAMVLSLAALPMNAFLNWLFIYGNWGFPRLELVGAGWATLITRIFIFIFLALIILYHKTFRRYIAVRSIVWKLNWKTIKELLQIGVPSSFQISMEAGAFAVSGILIGTIGAVEQAAHQIALSCASLTFMVSMGLSQAGSIRASNSFGRKDWKLINAIGKSTLLMALIYGTFCAMIFIFLRKPLALVFNENSEVVSMTSYLLLFAALFQISDSTQAISAGLLRGIKDVNVPTIFIAIAYWAIGIPVGCVLAFYFKMGAAGIWTGFITGLTFSATFLSLRFRKMVVKNS
ncbi:MAG TPA: MATE family efflux transporter [Hanamia sp.]|jgi:MATE family multidrug resistance protein|nr:MATE family efflux transporter [Hanamia sp.]